MKRNQTADGIDAAEFISLDDLCEFAGVQKTLLRRLEKTGKIPKKTPSGYAHLPALAAIIHHFREAKTRLSELKERKLENEAMLKEIELGELRGLFFDKAKLAAVLKATGRAEVGIFQRALETELPMKAVGLSEAEFVPAGKRLVDQLCRYFEDQTSQWRGHPKPLPGLADLKPGESAGGE
jgi:hypothetical protein